MTSVFVAAVIWPVCLWQQWYDQCVYGSNDMTSVFVATVIWPVCLWQQWYDQCVCGSSDMTSVFVAAVIWLVCFWQQWCDQCVYGSSDMTLNWNNNQCLLQQRANVQVCIFQSHEPSNKDHTARWQHKNVWGKYIARAAANHLWSQPRSLQVKRSECDVL